MATITISGLPEISTILDYTNIPVETVGITQRITGANLKNYLAALPALTATSGTISGKLTAGSLLVNGTATVIGAITSGGFTAPSATIGDLTATNLAVTGRSTFTGNVTAGNFISNGVYTTILSGTLATAAQPNITSVGTLYALTVTTPITGTITGSSSTVTSAAQPAITSVGTLTSLTVAGTVTAGSLSATAISVATLNPNTLNATTINSANYTMSGSFLPTSNETLNLGGPSNNFGTIYTKYISLTGGISTSAITHTGTSGAGDIGTQAATFGTTYTNKVIAGGMSSPAAAANYAFQSYGGFGGGISFNDGTTSATIFTSADGDLLNFGFGARTSILSVVTFTKAGVMSGTATTAKYADLAECYEADAAYSPGTVLMFGDATEVTLASGLNTPRVAGVISTNPAHLMNGALECEHVAKVALQGRVPCKVVGKIKRGDMLVTSHIDGVATAAATIAVGAVIGKALGNYNSESVGIIEVVVGRL